MEPAAPTGFPPPFPGRSAIGRYSLPASRVSRLAFYFASRVSRLASRSFFSILNLQFLPISLRAITKTADHRSAAPYVTCTMAAVGAVADGESLSPRGAGAPACGLFPKMAGEAPAPRGKGLTRDSADLSLP